MAAGDNKDVIVGDEPTELTFFFEAENRKFLITKQFIQLSGMLRDYVESIPSSSDNQLPVNDFPAKSHEIVIQLINLAKKEDEKAYEKAIKLEPVDTDMPAPMKTFFKNLNTDDCINAANYSAYLSNDFAKRYFVHAYADLVKETGPADLKNITAAFGATPLDKMDLETHELQNERQIWSSYPQIYKDAYGHDFDG
uniref:Uncharacterized protein n=1 Tax=Panagrolaimus davidi TaxID=227884 RepID=A0A914QJK8_9BILA